MKILRLFVLLFASDALFAQPVTGETTFLIQREDACVLDLSGSYTNAYLRWGTWIDVQHGPDGRLAVDSFTMKYPGTAGTATGHGRFARFGLDQMRGTVRVTGNLVNEGRTLPAVGKLTFFSIDGWTQAFWIEWRLGFYWDGENRRVSVETSGTQSNSVPVTGSWDLSTDLSADGRNLLGTAIAHVSNGRPMTFDVRGRYDAARDMSVLKLTGRGESAGANLNLNVRGADRAIIRMRGMLFGQRVLLPKGRVIVSSAH